MTQKHQKRGQLPFGVHLMFRALFIMTAPMWMDLKQLVDVFAQWPTRDCVAGWIIGSQNDLISRQAVISHSKSNKSWILKAI